MSRIRLRSQDLSHSAHDLKADTYQRISEEITMNLNRGARRELLRRHSVRKAAADTNYCAEFTYNKVNDFLASYGTNFRLILWGSEIDPDDFYCIPSSRVQHMFTDETLMKKWRVRWMVDIREDKLHVRNSPEIVSMESFYGILPEPAG